MAQAKKKRRGYQYTGPAKAASGATTFASNVQDAKQDEAAHYEQAGPSLLAAQPSNSPLNDRKMSSAGWRELSGHLETRLVGMRTWRLSWWQHWALLAAYILPRRYHWLVTPNSMSRGLPINQEIADSTGTLAMRVCSNGLKSGLSSPSRPWFKLRPALGMSDADKQTSLYLDEIERRIYRVMARSNFYEAVGQAYEDLVVFGTAPIIGYEDEETVVHFYNPCAGEYFLGAGATNRIDTLYRQFNMTVAQIVEMFGLENCGADIQGMWKEKGAALEQERIIAHAIEPNFAVERDGGSSFDVVGPAFTWREVYWMFGNIGDRPLSTRGFKDQPFVSPRWAVTSNDPYGRSPAMDALPDIMQLQVETKRKAEAIEKMVRPPMVADISMKNEPSSILPGHITYVANMNGSSGMKPMFEVKPQLSEMMADIREIQKRVQTCFFQDLFQMISNLDTVRTATEIDKRYAEKMEQLGPVIERFNSEALEPMIRRIYGIMLRKGLFNDLQAPPALQGQTLKVEFISNLAMAQRAAASGGMERLVATVGNLAGADPQVLDNVDFDEFVREYSDLLNVNPKIMRSAVDVASLRQQKAKAAQQQQQMQQSMAAVQGAKTLSETDVGGGANALAAILGRSPPTQ